jgi:hypothetical protein
MSSWSDVLTRPGIGEAVALAVGVTVGTAVTMGVSVAGDVCVGVAVGVRDKVGVFSGGKPHAGSLRQPDAVSSEMLTTPSPFRSHAHGTPGHPSSKFAQQATQLTPPCALEAAVSKRD